MAEIEGEIAPLLDEVIATKSFPSDAHFSSVMMLMGNVAVRNPRFRSMIEDLHVKIANGMMRMTLQDKVRYHDSIRESRQQGAPIRDDISYEDMKAFIERGEYKIAIDRTYLIGLELDSVPTVVEQLARWSWSFALAALGTTFITCDDPVVLAGADGKDGGHTLRDLDLPARLSCFRSRQSSRSSGYSSNSHRTGISDAIRLPTCVTHW